MAAPTDTFDLGRLRLTSGEGRRLTLGLRLGDFDFGGERYAVEPPLVDATLCLEAAAPVTSVDAREVHQPGGGEELTSPYVHDEELDLRGWAHDAYALALPAQVVCTPECAGLCPECGANLNTAGAEHGHEAAPDPRWAKLRELRFD
jgi:DUF177 domain-containing protein